MLLQPQLSGNGKGIALAGNADEQPVGGRERIHIELTGSILHAVCGQGVNLQFAVVGCCHGANLHVVQVIENGHGQSGTFHRIGTGAQLIEQHQRADIGFFQNGYDIGHMRGEGTEALLNTLLISDIGINLIKHGQF